MAFPDRNFAIQRFNKDGEQVLVVDYTLSNAVTALEEHGSKEPAETWTEWLAALPESSSKELALPDGGAIIVTRLPDGPSALGGQAGSKQAP